MSWLFAKRLRSFVLLAGGASLLLNLALLMPAFYMMQVFDRVFASGSHRNACHADGARAVVRSRLGYFARHRARSRARLGRPISRSTLSPARSAASLRTSRRRSAAAPIRMRCATSRSCAAF